MVRALTRDGLDRSDGRVPAANEAVEATLDDSEKRRTAYEVR